MASEEKTGLFCFAHYTESTRGDSAKTELDESQGMTLAESHEEADHTSLPVQLRMAAKRSAAYFCGSVRRTVSQKPEEMK